MASAPKDSAIACKGSGLGDLLESLSNHQPHSVELPERVTSIETCGDGVVMGLGDGKVLLVCVTPVPTTYYLESDSQHLGAVMHLAVAKDRETCLTSGLIDRCVKLWSLVERKELVTIALPGKWVAGLAITHNSLMGIIALYNDSFKVWDLRSGCELFSLENSRELNSLVLSTNSKSIYVGEDTGYIRVWDLEERKEVLALLAHKGKVSCLSLTPDNAILVSGSEDHTVRVWDSTNLTEIAFLPCQFAVDKIRLLPKSQMCIVKGLEKNFLQVWHYRSSRKISELLGHDEKISDLEVSADETFCLSSFTDSTIRMWDLKTNEEIAVFPGATSGACTIKLTEDNRHFITANSAYAFKMFSLAQKHGEKDIRSECELFAITSALVITASGRNISFFNWEDGREVKTVQTNQVGIKSMIVPGDENTLICGGEDCIEIWCLKSLILQHSFQMVGKVEQVRLAATADGKQLLSMTGKPFDHTLTHWNIEEKREINSTQKPCSDIRALVIRQNGDYAAFLDGDLITICMVQDFWFPMLFLGHKAPCRDLAFSPDGHMLISCGEDGAINFWNMGGYNLIYCHVCPAAVWTLNIPPAGNYMLSTSKDKTIRVWSLKERREMVSYAGNDLCGRVQFNTNSSYIAYCREKQGLALLPFVVPWESTDKQPYQITSEDAAIVRDCVSGNKLGKIASERELWPYHVNSLHICAYYNHAERCTEYLAAGVLFLKGIFGSPLTVALQRKTIKCVEVFLKYFISKANTAANDSEWPVFSCIVDDISTLLGCGSALLQPFFEVLMQPPGAPVLPSFITPRSELPIVLSSDNHHLRVDDFDISRDEEAGSELVKFAISLIKLNLTPGSAKSLELVEALQNCEDKTVLITPYISLIIEQKWNYFYSYTLAFTVLYAIMLTSLVMMLFNVWDTILLPCTFLAINAFFVLYEMAQMVADKWPYWMDPWNYVDVFRGLLSLFWGVLMLQGLEKSFLFGYDREIRLLLALLCLLRGFTYFRSFRMTRLFVYMTLAVIKEMHSFLYIMAYSVFAFGVCTSILLGHSTLGDSWTSAFSLVLGDFDSSTFGFLEWTIFSFAAIINVIIMLNLLVSILGDAYGMTQLSMRENDMYMMLDLVNEYESLMFWRRSAGSPVLMLTCDEALDTESVSEWAGQVTKITDKVRDEVGKATGLLREKLEAQKTDWKEAREKAEGQMEGVEKRMASVEEKLGKMEGKLGNLEEKLETILDLLKVRS